MKFLIALLAAPLFAAASVEVTATQAKITYTAPSGSACDIDVREFGGSAVVHDVDATLFTGANLDSRATGITDGTRRVIVVGKRAAEKASDNRLYSRALQAYTRHSYSLCSGTITGEFTTMNPPLGQTFGDPLPVDPLHPGQYAWPSFSWTDRTEVVIDPQTGIALRMVVGARDAYYPLGGGTFGTAAPAATNWTNPGNVNVDDSSVATYSAATHDWLLVQFDVGGFASKSVSNWSLNSLNPSLNAWGNAGSMNLEFALAVDRVPATDILSHSIGNCSSSCTGAGNRFSVIASPTGILNEWFASNGGLATFDIADISARGGTVNRTGTAVTWAGGDVFSLKWTSNSKITINAVEYPIASVDDELHITLGSGAGSDTGVSYTAQNGGVLVRNAGTTGTVSIQFVGYAAEAGFPLQLGSSGDQDNLNNCSAVPVTDGTGEVGEMCAISGGFYFHGRTTGKVNRLGRTVPTFHGAAPGWSQPGSSVYWDATDGNTAYVEDGQSVPAGTIVLKFVYSGNHGDIGDLGGFAPVVECGSSPCWTITNASATNDSIEMQTQAFSSTAWTSSHFRPAATQLIGRINGTNKLIFQINRDGGNNRICFYSVFDATVGAVTAALPVWATPPSTWSTCHGGSNMNDPNWVLTIPTTMRGSLSGNEAAGQGPYIATITSGAVPSTGTACPARPGGSVIPVSSWPTGSNCTLVTLDGQPGDPSPNYYDGGTISTSGAIVTLSGVDAFGQPASWNAAWDQTQIKVGSAWYRFTYATATTGSISPTPGSPLVASAYTMYLEEVNAPSVGNPLYGYLQDIRVGDIACIDDAAIANGCSGAYFPTAGWNEITRFLLSPGTNQWWIERGYAGATHARTSFASLSAGGKVVMLTGACDFGPLYPCSETSAFWNAVADPTGANVTGATYVLDSNKTMCCHGTTANGMIAKLANELAAPTRDSVTNGYIGRFNSMPGILSDPGWYIADAPPWHGKVGVGYTNSTDMHPGHQQSAASVNESQWFGDGRAFLGDDMSTQIAQSVFGSSANPGVLVSGQLWKWTAAQTNRLRPRLFSSLAVVGINPLLDISSATTGNVIGTSSTDSYKYCIANAVNECRTGSAVGDVYVNAPQLRVPYCGYPGIGQADYDSRDICIADMGTYTLGNVQIGAIAADPDGHRGRVVSRFGRYKPFTFWNNYTSPHGDWMLIWAPAVNGVKTSVLAAKLPPFPGGDSIARNDFRPVSITIPTVAGVDNAIVKFGYDTSFNCSSRTDACVANAATIPTGATPFAYISEAPAGLACSSGCTIQIPAISQRVVYFSVVLRDAGNATVRTDAMGIAVVR